MSLRIRDFFYYYPPQFSEDIQELLYQKKEFKELASHPEDTEPLSGSIYFRHQEFVKRFMSVYDRLLLIHRTGTGKSCSAFASSEQFKIDILSEFLDFHEAYFHNRKGIIKKVYVLTRGKLINEELIQQLICKCTPLNYFNEVIISQINEEEKARRKIMKNIKKFYSFESFVTFSKTISENLQKNKDFYENCMFIIDEVHILTSTEGLGKEEELDEDIMLPEENEMTKKNLKKAYREIHKLFLRSKNIKVLLMTATPMVNTTREIIFLMNLLLPQSKQIPEKMDLDKTDVREFEMYFLGLVSFVREIRPRVKVIREGEPIEYTHDLYDRQVPSKQNVYTVPMGSLQEQYYKHYSIRKRGEKRSSFFIRLRQACNFVFPSRQDYSKPDLRSLVEVFNERVRRFGEDNYAFTNISDINFFSSPDNLMKCSGKFLKVIRQCKEAEGNCFVFTEFLRGSGAFLLSVLFKLYYFEQFKPESNIFEEVEEVLPEGYFTADDTLIYKKICNPPEKEIKFKKIFQPKLRFALLTSETSKKSRDIIFKIFNSEQNKDGKYIKVIIGSRVTRTAINLSNVIQIHILEPSWNRSNVYQAESRGIRTGSHNMLLKDREEVTVRIFQYVSVFTESEEPETASKILRSLESISEEGGKEREEGVEEQEEVEEREEVEEQTEEYRQKSAKHKEITEDIDLRTDEEKEDTDFSDITIDVLLSLLAEKKDIKIRRVERVMKEMAVDCIVHKNRNVLKTDEPGTMDNDYEDSPLMCYRERIGFDKDKEDTKSFDILYSDSSDMNSIIKEVLDSSMYFEEEKLRSFSIPSAILIDAIRRDFKINDFVFSKFVHDLSIRKFTVDNQFMSSQVIREDGEYIFHDPFESIYSDENDVLVSYYSDNLFFQEQSILDIFLRERLVKRESLIIQELETYKDPKLVEERLRGFSLLTKIKEFEKAVIKKLNREPLPLYMQKLYKDYKKFLFTFREPTVEIKLREQELERAMFMKRPGRKRIKNVVKIKTPKGYLVKEPGYEAEKVYIHILRGQESQKTLYSVISRTLKGFSPRIYKPSEKVWRDMTEAEISIYISLIQSKNTQKLEDFKKKIQNRRVFGLITTTDNKFRIVIKTGEYITDIRKIPRGKVCKNWKKEDLKDLLKVLEADGIRVEITEKDIEEVPKDQICEKLKKAFEDEGLLYYL